jgi:hypothetical protein
MFGSSINQRRIYMSKGFLLPVVGNTMGSIHTLYCCLLNVLSEGTESWELADPPERNAPIRSLYEVASSG